MTLSAKNAYTSTHISYEGRLPRWTTQKLRLREDIIPALEKILAPLESAGFEERVIFAIRLALEEALVNAIKHGHKDDPNKEVQLRYQLTPDRLLVEVEDQGPGFNPHTVPDPLAVENLERSCGRGLLLMRHYMTWIRYNETGNCVTMCRQR